ncbi:MAG: saccharopine dehydrogenase NADP-binding domain-containing protein [Gammaproteobacteria bacterium]|nr:saccharopine dehydrogenase NADP-binding domain-containing protein [Gammaproteobacteria bacterium]
MTTPVPTAERPYDIVVWGASGFTGRLVAEYLLAHYPPGDVLRWAVAGRNRDKLATVLNDLGAAPDSVPILTGDSHDRASLQRIAGSTRVVLTTVGPYAKYGSELVEACAGCGTHYCDLTGEPQWMRRMIDAYEATARETGARIVHACGFDSIPSDFGVWFLQQQARARFRVPCGEIRLLVKGSRGGVSGGTVASGMNAAAEAQADREVARVLVDPYALNPAGERQGPDGRDQAGIEFDAVAGGWTAPFVMAAINTRIVRRTNALLDYPYGRDFRYREAVFTGKGPGGWLGAAGVTAFLGAMMLANASSWSRRNVLERLAPKPGEGPDRRTRETGFFNLLLWGRMPDGEILRARVRGDRDPGYGSTSKMLAESAICLAQDSIEVGGGFWTPVSAMGESLFARLTKNAGLSFELAEKP